MLEYLKYAGILIALIIVQRTLVSLIEVTSFQITPDLVIIGVVYVAIKKGKITGTVSGFVAGILLDIFSFSFLGLMALSKSVAGFIAGFFNVDNKTERYLNTFMFVVIVSIASLINNVIYFMIYFQGTNLIFTDVLLRYVLPTTVYTAIFSVIPVIFARRKKRNLH